jgi:hypothetical protein
MTHLITKFFRLFLFSLAVGSFCLPTFAQVTKEQALRVLTRDGTKEVIEKLAEAMPASARNHPMQATIDPEVARKVTEMMVSVFTVDRMNALILDGFSKNMDPKHVDPLVLWFDSPLGKRLVKAEVAVQRKSDQAQFAADAQAAMQRAKPARIALIGKLVAAMESTELTDNIMFNSLLSMVQGFRSAQSFKEIPMPGSSLADEQAKINEFRLKLRPQLASLVLTFSVVAYELFSDQEIQKYIAFANSPVGKGYALTMRNALNATFSELGDEAGKVIAVKLKQPST